MKSPEIFTKMIEKAYRNNLPYAYIFSLSVYVIYSIIYYSLSFWVFRKSIQKAIYSFSIYLFNKQNLVLIQTTLRTTYLNGLNFIFSWKAVIGFLPFLFIFKHTFSVQFKNDYLIKNSSNQTFFVSDQKLSWQTQEKNQMSEANEDTIPAGDVFSPCYAQEDYSFVISNGPPDSTILKKLREEKSSNHFPLGLDKGEGGIQNFFSSKDNSSYGDQISFPNVGIEKTNQISEKSLESKPIFDLEKFKSLFLNKIDVYDDFLFLKLDTLWETEKTEVFSGYFKKKSEFIGTKWYQLFSHQVENCKSSLDSKKTKFPKETIYIKRDWHLLASSFPKKEKSSFFATLTNQFAPPSPVNNFRIIQIKEPRVTTIAAKKNNLLFRAPRRFSLPAQLVSSTTSTPVDCRFDFREIPCYWTKGTDLQGRLTQSEEPRLFNIINPPYIDGTLFTETELVEINKQVDIGREKANRVATVHAVASSYGISIDLTEKGAEDFIKKIKLFPDIFADFGNRFAVMEEPSAFLIDANPLSRTEIDQIYYFTGVKEENAVTLNKKSIEKIYNDVSYSSLRLSPRNKHYIKAHYEKGRKIVEEETRKHNKITFVATQKNFSSKPNSEFTSKNPVSVTFLANSPNEDLKMSPHEVAEKTKEGRIFSFILNTIPKECKSQIGDRCSQAQQISRCDIYNQMCQLDAQIKQNPLSLKAAPDIISPNDNVVTQFSSISQNNKLTPSNATQLSNWVVRLIEAGTSDLGVDTGVKNISTFFNNHPNFPSLQNDFYKEFVNGWDTPSFLGKGFSIPVSVETRHKMDGIHFCENLASLISRDQEMFDALQSALFNYQIESKFFSEPSNFYLFDSKHTNSFIQKLKQRHNMPQLLLEEYENFLKEKDVFIYQAKGDSGSNDHVLFFTLENYEYVPKTYHQARQEKGDIIRIHAPETNVNPSITLEGLQIDHVLSKWLRTLLGILYLPGIPDFSVSQVLKESIHRAITREGIFRLPLSMAQPISASNVDHLSEFLEAIPFIKIRFLALDPGGLLNLTTNLGYYIATQFVKAGEEQLKVAREALSAQNILPNHNIGVIMSRFIIKRLEREISKLRELPNDKMLWMTTAKINKMVRESQLERSFLESLLKKSENSRIFQNGIVEYSKLRQEFEELLLKVFTETPQTVLDQLSLEAQNTYNQAVEKLNSIVSEHKLLYESFLQEPSSIGKNISSKLRKRPIDNIIELFRLRDFLVSKYSPFDFRILTPEEINHLI